MPKIAVNLDQWADGAFPDRPLTSGSQADTWQNGNLGSSQAHYAEGETVPYRAVMTTAKEGTIYWLTIEWDTTQQGKHAIDYINTWDASFPAGRNETVPNPLLGVAGLLTNNSTTKAIVADSRVSAGPDGIAGNADDIAQVSGAFTLFGGATNIQYVKAGADGVFNTADDVIAPADPYTLTGTYGGNSSTSVTMKFTYIGDSDAQLNELGSLVVAWGGHIATRADWGAGMSAAAISGSPYHMRLTSFVDNDPGTSESVGQQDRSLSSAAVVFPGAITVEKQTSPDGSSQLFNFEMTRPVNTVDVIGGKVDLSGDGSLVNFADDDGRFLGTTTVKVIDGLVDMNGDGSITTADDGTLNGLAVIDGAVDVNGSGTITADDKFSNLTGTGVVAFSLADNQQKTFGNLLDFGGYTVKEVNVPTGWDLVNITQARTDINNVTTTTTVTPADGVDSATVTVSEADTFKLTFNDAFIAAPSLNIVKDAVAGQTADVAGEKLNYTITVQNTGNVTLTGVTVTDPNADAGSIVRGADVVGDNDALLEVGETWGYTAQHTLTQAEIDSNGGGDGDIDNTATADSNETGPDTDDATIPVAQSPALNIVKDAVAGQIADVAGEKLNYVITVQNTGNTTLTGVTVTDPNADAGSILRGTDVVGDNDALLEVGETWGYTAQHTLTQAELDSNGGGDGDIDNIATADSNETGPDTDDATIPLATTASLNILKDAVAGQTADVAGEKLNYVITVQNTGNTTLTGVTVTDPNADAGSIVRIGDLVGDNDAVLEVGETWKYTAQHTLTQAEIDSNGGGDGDIDNVATADSNETGPDTDDATVPVARSPALDIDKVAVAGQTADVAGEKLNYTITVQNTGNTTLTGVTVTDPNADSGSIVRIADVVGDNDALLEVGETWKYTAQHTLTQAEIDSNGGGDGDIDNTATADSNETGPDTDDATIPVARNPALNIVKTAVAGQTADVAGEKLNYTISVQNTGNTTLTGVTVTDPNADTGSIVRVADAVGDNDALLEVGETWSYTAQHTVTQAELDSNGGGDGDIDNIATADSNETGPDTDDATVPVAQNPALNIVKDAVAGQTADVAGEKLNYVITVQNTGNTTLTGVTVTDPNADAGSIVRIADLVGDNDALLEVGETWKYTAQHTVTQAEIDSNGGGDGDIDNVATADSNETGPDTDDATVPVAQNADFAITKTPTPASGASKGTVINYDIAVQNTGNVTLTGVSVTDKVETDATTTATLVSGDTDGDSKLDVGETWHYSASYTVTQNDVDTNGRTDDGDIDNRATATTTQAGSKSADAQVTLLNPGPPVIDIEKFVSVDGGQTWLDADSPTGPILLSGNVPMFKYEVTNLGALTLTSIVVKDDNGTPANTGDDKTITLTTGLTDVDGDGTADDLAAGAKATGFLTGTFQAGQYTNIATADGQSLTGVAAAQDSDAANYFGFAPITISGSPQFNFPNSLTQIQPKLQGADAFIINPLGYISWDFYTPNDALASINTLTGYSTAYAGLTVSIAEIWNSDALNSTGTASQAIYRIYVANEGSTSVALANNTDIVDYSIIASSTNKGLIDLVNSDPLIGNFNSFSNIENAVTKVGNGFGTSVGAGNTVDKIWSSPDLNGTGVGETPVAYDTGGGNDALYGRNNTGTETLSGGLGNDMIEGRNGIDAINGGDGNDQLYGSLGDDTINGGNGNDILFGSYGSNVLTGGSGADIFIVRKGSFATITDFNAGDGDQIRVWLETLDGTEATGSHTTLYDAASGVLTIDGTPVAQLGLATHPALLPVTHTPGGSGMFLT